MVRSWDMVDLWDQLPLSCSSQDSQSLERDKAGHGGKRMQDACYPLYQNKLQSVWSSCPQPHKVEKFKVEGACIVHKIMQSFHFVLFFKEQLFKSFIFKKSFLTQVSDPRHVLVWVGGAHYRGINCVAENNERNFYIHVIFPNSPKREKNTKPLPNTWDLGQE